jgi:hypothetical protein
VNVTADTLVTNYVIVYKEAFYQSMLYRAFMGFGPSDVGETSQGIPGFSGSLSDVAPLQGWNMSHFRVVYKTAYYNPFTDYADHSDSWTAISFEEAVALKARIDAGLEEGTVDLSVSGLAQGIVFLQYYDGAIIEGNIVATAGAYLISRNSARLRVPHRRSRPTPMGITASWRRSASRRRPSTRASTAHSDRQSGDQDTHLQHHL